MVKVWHAVYTRSRTEKKVVEKLKDKGYTCYLPTVKTIKQWSDRKKTVEIPLISSYVFVQISENEQLNVLNIPGIVSFVRDKSKPAIIPDWQINVMKDAVDGNMNIALVNEQLKPGQAVKVINGPLKGHKGELLKTSNQSKLIIHLEQLNFVLSVEVNASDVEKI